MFFCLQNWMQLCLTTEVSCRCLFPSGCSLRVGVCKKIAALILFVRAGVQRGEGTEEPHVSAGCCDESTGLKQSWRSVPCQAVQSSPPLRYRVRSGWARLQPGWHLPSVCFPGGETGPSPSMPTQISKNHILQSGFHPERLMSVLVL